MLNRDFGVGRILSAREARLYVELLDGLQNMDRQIRVNETNNDVIAYVIEALALNETSLYFLNTNGFDYRINYTQGYTALSPRYTMSASRRKYTDDKLQRAICDVTSLVTASNEIDKALQLHDILCSKLSYKDNGLVSHTIVGSLLTGQAVCDGISKAFKTVCDKLGVECLVVAGIAQRDDCGNFGNHSWNKVKAQGNWYNVDVTFDLTLGLGKIPCHDYFLVSDHEIFSSHKEYNQRMPCCAVFNYYEYKSLVTRTPRDVYFFVLNNYRKGMNVFEVHIPDMLQISDIERKLFNAIESALSNFIGDKRVAVSLNKQRSRAFISIE